MNKKNNNEIFPLILDPCLYSFQPGPWSPEEYYGLSFSHSELGVNTPLLTGEFILNSGLLFELFLFSTKLEEIRPHETYQLREYNKFRTEVQFYRENPSYRKCNYLFCSPVFSLPDIYKYPYYLTCAGEDLRKDSGEWIEVLYTLYEEHLSELIDKERLVFESRDLNTDLIKEPRYYLYSEDEEKYMGNYGEFESYELSFLPLSLCKHMGVSTYQVLPYLHQYYLPRWNELSAPNDDDKMNRSSRYRYLNYFPRKTRVPFNVKPYSFDPWSCNEKFFNEPGSIIYSDLPGFSYHLPYFPYCLDWDFSTTGEYDKERERMSGSSYQEFLASKRKFLELIAKDPESYEPLLKSTMPSRYFDYIKGRPEYFRDNFIRKLYSFDQIKVLKDLHGLNFNTFLLLSLIAIPNFSPFAKGSEDRKINLSLDWLNLDFHEYFNLADFFEKFAERELSYLYDVPCFKPYFNRDELSAVYELKGRSDYYDRKYRSDIISRSHSYFSSYDFTTPESEVHLKRFFESFGEYKYTSVKYPFFKVDPYAYFTELLKLKIISKSLRSMGEWELIYDRDFSYYRRDHFAINYHYLDSRFKVPDSERISIQF